MKRINLIYEAFKVLSEKYERRNKYASNLFWVNL